MKQTIIALSVFALFASATPASAYQGDPSVQGPSHDPARHEAMTQVFNNKDYQGWLKLMADKGGRIKEVITSSQIFSKFVDARSQGKDALQAFRAEYGLGQRDGKGAGRFHHRVSR